MVALLTPTHAPIHASARSLSMRLAYDFQPGGLRTRSPASLTRCRGRSCTTTWGGCTGWS